MGKLVKNYSNVHVCSLARASIRAILLSYMRRILISLKIYKMTNNDSLCVKWSTNEPLS